MTEPLLDIRNLSVSFATESGPVTAVQDVSLSVAQGEIVSVVGESGSGKSLSLLSVLGLHDPRNTTVGGTVTFRGQSLLDLPPKQMRHLRGRDIAFISQDPMTALTPVYSIGDQIAEQIRAHERITAWAAQARAVQLLADVGIFAPADTAKRYPHQLSGGMRQRAVIAMAVSCNPALLIADEPTTALDTTVQAQVLDLLRKLRTDYGSAIVLITHDMGVVAEMADKVVVMYAGRVVESGPAAEVFTNPLHPYTWGLLGSIPPLTGTRPRRLPSIPGAPPMVGRVPAGCAFAPRCPARLGVCSTEPPRIGTPGHTALCHLTDSQRATARPTTLESA